MALGPSQSHNLIVLVREVGLGASADLHFPGDVVFEGGVAEGCPGPVRQCSRVSPAGNQYQSGPAVKLKRCPEGK